MMRPNKTELARQTLETHGKVLGMRERRLLILCDGRRSINDLKQLFGEDAATLAAQLIASGYLSMAEKQRSAPSAALQTETAPVDALESALHPQSPPLPRRSLVAAKVYLVGVLELQRDEQAAIHRRQLQSRLDEPALLEAMAKSLAYLRTRVAPSLVARVHERLLEALPHEEAHRLHMSTDDIGRAEGHTTLA